MEQTPRFHPSHLLCQFLQIFLENLSLFENFFFSPPALRCLCVSRCMCVRVCGCVSVCVQAHVHVFAVCVFELLMSKYMYLLDLWALRAMHFRLGAPIGAPNVHCHYHYYYYYDPILLPFPFLVVPGSNFTLNLKRNGSIHHPCRFLLFPFNHTTIPRNQHYHHYSTHSPIPVAMLM